ncbi:MAG TPA: hypothetical protein VK821_02345 [Dehalococcoidia bacterium]|nr:hypothetical protein [Dehalococcoidia bacterium]
MLQRGFQAGLCRPVVAVLFATLLAIGFRVPAYAQQVGDTGLLGELASRLVFLSPTLGADGQPLAIQLLPGQLPDGLAITLPVPTDARLIGSAVQRTADNTLVSARVVLDVPESADQVISYYDQAVAASGLAPRQSFPSLNQGGGFQTSFQSMSRLYCQAQNTVSLSVLVTPQPNGPSQVMLNAMTPASSASSCSLTQGSPGVGILLTNGAALPKLVPPDGVRVQQPSGNVPFVANASSSEVIASTDMAVAELEDFYAQQLTAAGWTATDSGSDSNVAWAIFSVPGSQPATGFLYVLSVPGQARRVLHVQTTSTAPVQQIPFAIPG